MPHVPNIGTIVPNMGTRAGALSNILFSGSRRSILALLYGHADEQFYLREITRRAGTGIGATQRELRQLSEAGLIQDVRRGRQVYYQANRKNPIFVELKSILAKTLEYEPFFTKRSLLLRIGLSSRSCTARLHEARKRRRATWT